MNFSALKTELQARGFDYLTSTRQGYMINRAYQRICEEEDWPFLTTSISGTAPLTIDDLRTIESVTIPSTYTKLAPLDRRAVSDQDPTLALTGTPGTYYISGGDTVNVFPVGTATIQVYYWKVPDDLSADADTPLIPSRFHHTIIDCAVGYAYQDSDNFDAAMQAFQMCDLGIEIMRQSLLVQQHDQPENFILWTDPHDA